MVFENDVLQYEIAVLIIEGNYEDTRSEFNMVDWDLHGKI